MDSEKTIENFTVKEAMNRGGKAFKFTSPAQKGVPDRMIVLPGGKVGFLELKSSTGKPTKLQEHWINFLQTMGLKAGIANSKETVKKFMDNL